MMSNPYLQGKNPYSNRPQRFSLGAEVKRLFGHPVRLLATLFLVILPFLVSLAGGLDLLTGWLYTVARYTRADPRTVVSVFDCLADQTRKLCQGVRWASATGPKRLVLYPWHGWDPINKLEPYLFSGCFFLAFMAFIAIGNPRMAEISRILGHAFGFGSGGKNKANKTLERLSLEITEGKSENKKGKDSSKGESQARPLGPIPRLELDKDCLDTAWRSNLIIGGYIPRLWESDPGYFYLDRQAAPVPYWLSLNMLRTNLVIVAPQGSGKTYSIYRPLLAFMRRSNSAGIFWDSKGDDFNPAFFDYNFDPTSPRNSFKLNIFAGATPAEAGERLAEALVPDLGGDKQYFSNNAKDALSALTAAHAAGFGLNPTLRELLDYLTTPDNVQNLHDRVLEKLRGPENREEALRLSTLLHRVMHLAENKNTDVLGNLATALSPLVTGTAASVLETNPGPGAYTIEELLRRPGLIRLALPVAKSPRLAPILGRLVLAQFTYAVLSPDCNRSLFKLAAVDEARYFITENVASGMAQARSNNAGYVLALQTLSQIKDESLLDTIFAVSGTKIVMAGVGDKDAHRFSNTFGTLELPYVTHSQGFTSGSSRNSGTSYSRGQEYESFGGQSGREARSSRGTTQGKSQTSSSSEASSTATRPRPRFFPVEIRELAQFHSVIESSDDQGRRWFAQVIDMRASTVSELEGQVLDRLAALKKARAKSKKEKASQKQSKMSRANTGQPQWDMETGNINRSAPGWPPHSTRPVFRFQVSKSEPDLYAELSPIRVSNKNSVPGLNGELQILSQAFETTGAEVSQVPTPAFTGPVAFTFQNKAKTGRVCKWCGEGDKEKALTRTSGEGNEFAHAGCSQSQNLQPPSPTVSENNNPRPVQPGNNSSVQGEL